MKLYEPIQLKTWQLIKDEAMNLLEDQAWDHRSERLYRMPMHGHAFDEVSKELAEKGLPRIGIWTIFARGPRGVQQIHVDAFSQQERVNSGIIVPVLGTTRSKMQWFSEEGTDFQAVQTPDKKSYYFRNFSKEIPKMIEELEIFEPIIAKISMPHRAVASDFSARAVVSIKLVGNPELL